MSCAKAHLIRQKGFYLECSRRKSRNFYREGAKTLRLDKEEGWVCVPVGGVGAWRCFVGFEEAAFLAQR